MKKICFFSSDARPLYKRDVFRAMSYPSGFIIHFRYRSIHIQGTPESFIGKDGVIFLSMGNDLSKPEVGSFTNTSIRDVKIKHVEITPDTGLVHFYLELGDFKKYDIVTAKSDIMPPNKLVTELDLSGEAIIIWHELIEIIKPSFLNQLFYKFDILDGRSKQPAPLDFNLDEKQSFYRLKDESSYILDIAFYDTEPSASSNYHSLKVTSFSDKLKIVAPETIDIEARRDNRSYTLFTQTITSSNSFAYVNLETMIKSIVSGNIEVKSIVDTTLKVHLIKNSKRSIAFGLYSILAASSVAYAKLITDKIDLQGTFSWCLAIQIIIAGILGFISAFNLYRLFDKK